MPDNESWQPVPVPQGDGRHDIGDDVRAAIFHRLHDDFTLSAPWMTAEQRRHLAMFAAASVRALLHEIGTLRDMSISAPPVPDPGTSEGAETRKETASETQRRKVRGWALTELDRLLTVAVSHYKDDRHSQEDLFRAARAAGQCLEQFEGEANTAEAEIARLASQLAEWMEWASVETDASEGDTAEQMRSTISATVNAEFERAQASEADSRRLSLQLNTVTMDKASWQNTASDVQAENHCISSQLAGLREASQRFLQKWEVVLPAINSAFFMGQIHGERYTGPTINAEIDALRAALAVSQEPKP